MVANLKEYIAAGFDRGFYTLLDSAGYAAGVSGSVSSGAAGESAGRMKGVQTADLNITEPETVPVLGDDTALGTFIFPPDELPSFTIEVGMRNLTDEARFQQTLVENIGNISLGVLQPVDPVYSDTALLFSRRDKSKAAGSDGVGGYEHLIVPRANVVPLGNVSLQGRTAATGRYRVAVSTSDQKLASGATFTNAANGTTGGVIVTVTSNYLMTWHTFVGTGALTLFGPLAYTPATTSLDDILVYKDGLRMTTGVTISADGYLTFSVAPALNSKIVVFYSYTQ